MITVKDIRDKEFGRQKHGYMEDEVDDFLDEIADQMEALIRENRAMMQKVEEAQAAQAKAESAAEAPVYVPPQATPPQPAEAPAQKADDAVYFRNLETTLRETLISAQRIADETVGDAKRQARQMVSDAEKQAETLRASAKAEAEALLCGAKRDAETAKTEYELIKLKTEEYRQKFVSMVEEQMRLIKTENK